MSKRFLKQFLYGLSYLLVLLGIGAVVYLIYFKPPPSCFDGKRNGGEAGIDCDGPCAKVCTPLTIRLPEITGVPKVITISPAPGDGQRITAFARIQNPNTDYAVRNMSYTVTVFDGAGVSVGTRTNAASLYAGEIVYLVEANIEPSGLPPFAVEFSFGEPVWARAGSFVRPEASLRDRQIVNDERGTVARGTIVNQDTLPIPELTVIAVFYDTKGVLLGASKTVVADIFPQEARPFSVFHPLLPDVDPAKTEIVLHPERTP